jgi:hypothetical protein
MLTWKRSSIWLLLAVLALLDLAALDDITTGTQPDFVSEWVMVLMSIPVGYFLIERLRRKHAVSAASDVAIPGGPDSEPLSGKIAELQQSYVAGRIDLEQYERELDAVLRLTS